MYISIIKSNQKGSTGVLNSPGAVFHWHRATALEMSWVTQKTSFSSEILLSLFLPGNYMIISTYTSAKQVDVEHIALGSFVVPILYQFR